MRIYYFLILLAIILQSCNAINSKDEFERKLLDSDLIVLKKWEGFYNKLLSDNYAEGSFEASTKSFLNHILIDNSRQLKYNKNELCRLIDDYRNSTLEHKIINLKYDTVYEVIAESEVIITIDQEGNKDFTAFGDVENIKETQEGKMHQLFIKDSLVLESEEYIGFNIGIFPPGHTLSDEINEIRNQGYFKDVSESSFINTLKSLENKSIDIEGYLEERGVYGGTYGYQRIGHFFLKNEEINFNEKFIKRVIVFEIVMKYFERNNDC